MKGCCGTAPQVWKATGWSCSECGSVTKDASSFSPLAYKPFYIDTQKEEKKCTCGATRTYGINATHSIWCDKIKK